MPATGTFAADDYISAFSHKNESAHPGYYQVYLERYGVNVGDIKKFTIIKKNGGKKINAIRYGDEKISNYFIMHGQLKQGKQLIITTL